MELIENKPKLRTKSYKVWKNKSLRAEVYLLQSSKCRAFLSLQRYHIKQWGTIFQTTIFRWSLRRPCHPAQRSSTWQGITQCTPNKPKIIDHSSQAMEQCNNRWSTLSPLCLHIQHQSTIIRFHFHKLSMVKSLPKAAVQEKKATLGGTLAFQIIFQGKNPNRRRTCTSVMLLNREPLIGFILPTQLILSITP